MLYILFTVLNIATPLQISSVYIPQFESGQDDSCQYMVGKSCPLYLNPQTGQSFLVNIGFRNPFKTIPQILLTNRMNDELYGLNGYQIEAQSITTTQFTLNYTGLSTLTEYQLNVQWLAVDDNAICIHYVCLSPTPALSIFLFQQYIIKYRFNNTYPWYEAPNAATFITGLVKLSYLGASTYNISAQIQQITISDFVISLPQDGTTQYQICLHSIFGPKEYLLIYPQVINFNTSVVSSPQIRYYQVALTALTTTLGPSAYLSGFTQYNYVTNDNQRLFIDLNYTGYLTWWGDAYTVLVIGVMRILYVPFICNSPMQVQNLNFCTCILGQYFQNYTSLCQLCQNSCVGCQYSATNCTQCGVNQSLITPAISSPSNCQCNSHYYLISGTQCGSCDSSCGECLGAPTVCTSCGQYQTLINSTCSCNDGYYLISGTQCGPCDGSCLKCITLATTCTACGQNQTLSSNTCSCIDGYYLISGTLCAACDTLCVNCRTSPTTCTTCGLNQTLTNSKCSCIDGYYLISGTQCGICNGSCVTCSAPITCISCGQYQKLNPNNTCSCNDGYYLISGTTCGICDITCYTCVSNALNCTSCGQYQILTNNTCTCNTGYYLISGTSCEQCDQECLTCTQSADMCTNCGTNAYLQSNSCQCNLGTFSTDGPNCLKCDISCFQCESLSLCTSCSTGYYLDQVSCPKCDKNCLTCVDESINCVTCRANAYVNDNNQCTCDQGYYMDFTDNCQKCELSCYNCTGPLNSQCTECSEDKNFINNYCVCSEGQYIDEQGKCQDCSEECATCDDDSSCLTCKPNLDNYYSEGQCLSCKAIAAMTVDICNYADCTDEVWTKGEQCDDGNDIDRDGCSDCQIDTNYRCINVLLQQSFCYTCPQGCLLCTLTTQNQVICNQCQNGYYIQNNQCSFCNKNCVTCSTFNICLTCQISGFIPNSNGRCPQCEDTPGLHTIGDKCQTRCGDSVIAGIEECDDGNLLNGDGCSLSCSLEYGYILQDGKPYQIPIPNSTVAYVNSTALTNFTVNTGQNDTNICSALSISIDYYNSTAYNFTILPSQSSLSASVSCSIQFNFTQSLNSSQLIHFQIPYTIPSSRRLLDYYYREVIITPRSVIVYSQSQVAQAQSVQSTSSTFTLILYFVGPGTVILGGFECFFRILDILAWINNLYFINIQYPLNVGVFFQNSGWASVQLIPQFMQFNQPGDPYYTESPRKFMDLGVDPLFINNAYQSLSIVLVIILAHILTRILNYTLNLLVNSEEQMQQAKDIKPKNNLKHLLEIFHNQVKIFNKNIISHLIQGLNLAFLDLVLAVVMHLLYFKTKYLRYYPVFISASLTVLSIILIIAIIKLSIKITNKHSKLLSAKSIETKFGVLYEDVNRQSRIALKYSVFNILRKTFFIINLIVFYNSPLIQTLFSCMISLMNIALILYENPFDNRKALISNVVPDFCIFGLMFICSLLALDDQIRQLDQNYRFQIGWVMLGLIAISILTQLFFVLQVFSQRAYGYIKSIT